MTNTFTKTIAALTIAAAAITGTAQAEETTKAVDISAHVAEMSVLTTQNLDKLMTQKTGSIVMIELAALDTQTEIVLAKATERQDTSVQVAYASVPAYLLVPVAD
ncbi:hypothetical protein [Parvularcula sp. IMCC14364]|uniref:hypothetical protein n=1 Tax=Parvularcula sp. IMCC14364 TaxID=3067902 RepID=UPI0027426DF7|nr:hypothetical protein [Parvularcula sp. IMCC14364]